MLISSRTPEGLPNRCPICGGDFDLEPSLPTGDAPCPQRGHVLWWFQRKYEGMGLLIDADTELIEQLKADSLDVVELAMELEDEFEVEFAMRTTDGSGRSVTPSGSFVSSSGSLINLQIMNTPT